MYADGLNPSCFDAGWRKLCTVEHVGLDTIRDMVEKHYLHKRPAINMCSLAMYCAAWCVGMIIFSEAPKETSVRYGGKTWELARLWIDDSVPRNAETWMIGKAIKHVKKYHPEVKCLVSYADPSVGHKGYIYKAANWIEDGMTDDDRKTPRCDPVDAVTGKKYGRWSHVKGDVIMVPRTSKYRFYYRLSNVQHS